MLYEIVRCIADYRQVQKGAIIMAQNLRHRLIKLVNREYLTEKDLERIIIIPPNATNEEVLKAVFPNIKITVNETGEIAHIHENTLIKDNFMFVQVSTKWLNTPYKTESEE